MLCRRLRGQLRRVGLRRRQLGRRLRVVGRRLPARSVAVLRGRRSVLSWRRRPLLRCVRVRCHRAGGRPCASTGLRRRLPRRGRVRLGGWRPLRRRRHRRPMLIRLQTAVRCRRRHRLLQLVLLLLVRDRAAAGCGGRLCRAPLWLLLLPLLPCAARALCPHPERRGRRGCWRAGAESSPAGIYCVAVAPRPSPAATGPGRRPAPRRCCHPGS